MSNKTVLITGCSSGIGYLTALKFMHNGYRTFASFRNINNEGAEKLKEIASIENLPLETVKIDVDDNQSVSDGVAYVKSKTDRVDVLVNNAGFGYIGPVEDFHLDEIRAQYNTNIFGAIRMIKEVLPMMRDKKEGRIINVSSVSGLLNFPLYGVYCSSKHALESLSEALSFELAPFNIKVSCVEPGSFYTNFSGNKKFPLDSQKPESPYKILTKSFPENSANKLNSLKLLVKHANPEKVANKIFSVAESENPRLHNVIGLDAHIYLFARKIIPYSLWRLLLRKVYNW